MARKVAPSHYLAASPSERADRAVLHGYSTDGEESRAPSDRTLSEYMVANERAAVLPRHSRLVLHLTAFAAFPKQRVCPG